MGQSADVRSHESIERFRIALMEFQEICSQSLMLLETEKFRAIQWLEYDMPTHWKKQIRVRYDQVSEARTRLTSCKMRGSVGDKKPSCIEEKKDLERAKTRLEFAQEMVHVVRRWAMKVHKESDEFTGRVGRCKSVIDHDVTHAVFLLKKMVEALEKYMELSAPSGEGVQIQKLESQMKRPIEDVKQTETSGEEASSSEEANDQSSEESGNQVTKDNQ